MTVFVRQEDVDGLLAAYNANDKGPTHADTVAALQTMIQNASVDYSPTNTISVFLKDLINETPMKKPSTSPTPIVGYCPLTNVGNSCYMNSAIQLLYSIPELRTFVSTIDIDRLTKDHIRDCVNDDETLNNATTILFAMRDLNTVLTGTTPINLENINGKDIYKIFTRILTLEYKRQETSTDFINNLFGKINCVKGQPDVLKFINLFNYTFQESYKCAISGIYKNKQKNGSDRVEESTMLVINVEQFVSNNPSMRQSTLQDQINFMLKYEEIPDEKNNMTSVCGTGINENELGKYTAKKITVDVSKSTYLLITLNRFSGDYRTTIIKLKNNIIPNNKININNNIFEIMGVIIQTGILNKNGGGGHYVYVVYENGKPAFTMDDSEVSTQFFDKINSDGIVFLYRRVHPAVGGARTTRKHARSRVHAPTRKSSRSLPQTWEADKGESQTELL